MHAQVAELLGHVHPLFKAGVPHLRSRHIIPIETHAHFIAFDVARVSPLYTMLTLTAEDQQINLDRTDNFTDGDYTLPDELATRESDYEHWNREHPDHPLDRGHSAGSQFRRNTAVAHSDIDMLAGCCPETPACNRTVKAPLESAIKKRAADWTEVKLVQGPVWYESQPRNGKLRSGQWIPDAVFISSFWRHRKSLECWTFLMQNTWQAEDVGLKSISLTELEDLTGLVLWDRVRRRSFVKNRDKVGAGTWWKVGH